MNKVLNVLTLSTFSSLVFFACSGGGSDSDSSGGTINGPTVDSVADSGGLQTTCGVIADAKLRNPVNTSRGKKVSVVSVLDSNALIVKDEAGEQSLIKLQGVGGTTGFRNTAAQELFTELAKEELTYFPVEGCQGSVIGDQVGAVGQVVTASGKSFTESLIASKFAGLIETSGNCGEASLSACYAQISAGHEHHQYGPAKDCEENVPGTVRYNPDDDANCGGNASVTLTGDYGSPFSVQLRYPDGTDRITESCESPSCTPLKVQDYIRSSGQTIACFGAPGQSVALSDVNHVSIKLASDDHNPPRFCIADPAQKVN